MSAKTISIMGCGWLGLPLAEQLVSGGNIVKGSTATSSKITSLKEKNIVPFLISADPNVSGDALDKFFEAEIIVITLPFRRDLTDPRYYQQQIESIIKEVSRSKIKKVIFTGSTSIYSEEVSDANEGVDIEPHNDRSSVLLAIEELLINNRNFNSIILRLAGLYGGQRKIGQFMAGKQDVPYGNKPVNLAHLDDCVNIIIQIIQSEELNGVFNICSDGHPTRREIYTQAAIRLGKETPDFLDDKNDNYKIVNNQKIKNTLNYSFIHPDPMKDI